MKRIKAIFTAIVILVNLFYMQNIKVSAIDEENARQQIIDKATFLYNTTWSPAVKCYGWLDYCSSIYDTSNNNWYSITNEEDTEKLAEVAKNYNATHPVQWAEVGVDDQGRQCLVVRNVYAPKTLYHIPYGIVGYYDQAAGNSGKYIRYCDESLLDGETFIKPDQFIVDAMNRESNFYIDYQSTSGLFDDYNGVAKCGYMCDCSCFVTDCWNYPRASTGALMKMFNPQVQLKNGIANIKPGDALCKPGHVILVYDIYKSEDSGVTFYTIMQESGLEAQLNKITYLSAESFIGAWGDYYIIEPTPEVLGNINWTLGTNGYHTSNISSVSGDSGADI